jgi:2-amino-4-hydroxy-6-hydroxymethyldihydropteridine diphosphokinase
MSALAYLGLGANLGDARLTLEQALEDLSREAGVLSCEHAHFYGSAPIEATGPDFVNTVAKIHTSLTPLALLAVMQSIEMRYGRQRAHHNAPRTLDLDLLWFEGVSLTSPQLSLPHPRMHLRAFVLKPLSELDSTLQLPQGDVMTLLAQCKDQTVWQL